MPLAEDTSHLLTSWERRYLLLWGKRKLHVAYKRSQGERARRRRRRDLVKPWQKRPETATKVVIAHFKFVSPNSFPCSPTSYSLSPLFPLVSFCPSHYFTSYLPLHVYLCTLKCLNCEPAWKHACRVDHVYLCIVRGLLNVQAWVYMVMVCYKTWVCTWKCGNHEFVWSLKM